MQLTSFVGKSYLEQSPSSEASETINLFLENLETENGKGRYVFYRSPGLRTLLTLGGASIRGLLPLNRLEGVSANDGIWGVSGTTATLFDTSGNVVVTRSPIPDDGAMVSLAASLTAFAISTAGSVYYIDASGLHGPITWWGPGITIGDIGVINEFFLFLDAGSYVSGFYYSEPGDINSGTSLNFVPAEASANKFVKLLVDRQEAWMFGSQLIEVFFDNSANDPNNPFAPNLSAVIPHGIAARQSAISVNGRICWLGKSKSEVGMAFTTNGGYVAQRVSNHAVEYQWSSYQRIDDAISWTLTIKGHPLWRIWFPSADVTWEYDFSVDDWRKVLYWDADRAQYHAHLGQVACAAGNRILVGARNSGKIYTTSLDHMDDDGARIRWLRRTPILTNENKRVAYPWFELDMQMGVGLACPTITVTLPAATATAGVAYSSSVVASGGTGPYTYSIASGALPDGLSLNATTGAITGTPSASGTFNFTIQATDDCGCGGASGATIVVGALTMSIPLEMLVAEIFDDAFQVDYTGTQLRLDPADYGGLGYISEARFEVVISTQFASTTKSVQLVDGSGTVYATITQASHVTYTRLSTTFTPASAPTTYYVRIPQSTAGDELDLDIYEARIWLDLVHAPQAKIQILLGGDDQSTGGGAGSAAEDIRQQYSVEGSQSTYGYGNEQVDTSHGKGWTRILINKSKWATIDHWELEAIVGMFMTAEGESHTGTLGLLDVTASNAEVATLTHTTSVNTSPTRLTASISHASIPDGHELECQFKLACLTCGLDKCTFRIYRVALYAIMTGASKAQVYIRSNNSASGVNFHNRVKFELSKYDGTPTIYREMTAYGSAVNPRTQDLIDTGTSDVATAGSIVTGSTLTFVNGSRTRQRSPALTLTDGNRYGQRNGASGTAAIYPSDGFLIVEVAH